jgi:hypothetical protein
MVRETADGWRGCVASSLRRRWCGNSLSLLSVMVIVGGGSLFGRYFGIAWFAGTCKSSGAIRR